MQKQKESILATVAGLRASFHAGKSKSYEFRIFQLRALRRMLKENEEVFVAALNKDLGRGEFESVVLDMLPLFGELDVIEANLWKWMQPQATPVPSVMLPAASEIISEPYGVCLIISPYNYPLQLAVSSLAGAICAGNCALLKPSEVSAATEKALEELIPKYLDTSCFAVVCGGVETTTTLLNDVTWDKIFFTGSVRVGKIVAHAAAEKLTPVTLELGGKSPAICDESVENLPLVVKRLLWGKLANAGQTCIAPDFALVHAKHYDAFLKLAVETIKQFYGPDPKKSPDFARIVSKAAAARLAKILAEKPGRVVIGGRVDVEDRYVEPTVIADLSLSSSSLLMAEEIFGPILPVIKYTSIDDAIASLQKLDKPLALYVFGKSRANIDRWTGGVTSGGVTVNDVVIHVASPFLPFGGVGTSGLGSYHGVYSFKSFSHARSVLRRHDASWSDVWARYPPFDSVKLMVYRLGFKVPAAPLLRGWLVPVLVAGATWSLCKWLGDKA